MKYTVHQIHLTNEQVDEVNSSVEWPSYYARKTQTTVSPDEEKIAAAWNAGDYAPACRIEADSLEGVYEVGNIGPAEQIEPLGKWHSVSVGDVVENENGDRYYVASFGFEEFEGSTV